MMEETEVQRTIAQRIAALGLISFEDYLARRAQERAA